jgi:hypothetical protein
MASGQVAEHPVDAVHDLLGDLRSLHHGSTLATASDSARLVTDDYASAATRRPTFPALLSGVLALRESTR